jgi:hypothetical protein|tara:strand:+ start:1883 stop:2428 length:546 start_codon:yes stop_codon:yes gene_type:complete
MSDNETIITAVKQWLEKTVIGLQLCPFAKSVFDADKIRYTVSNSRDTEALMLELHDELKRLDDVPGLETTLIIINQQLSDFEAFNQTLDYIDDMLDQYGWSGIFQVASFHPYYQFADTKIDDRENWTNRSPYPIFHILRESSLELAIESFPSIVDLPQENIKRMNGLSSQVFAQVLQLSQA